MNTMRYVVLGLLVLLLRMFAYRMGAEWASSGVSIIEQLVIGFGYGLVYYGIGMDRGYSRGFAGGLRYMSDAHQRSEALGHDD